MILIIGKTPPPIGGVTIHVKRLIEHLKLSNIAYSYCNMTNNTLLKILIAIRKAQIIHLHSSNPYFRFFISLFCFLNKKILLQTYHGDIGRFGFLRNYFDYGSILLAKVPIAINTRSYHKALHINKNTKLIPAFLEPVSSEKLKVSISNKINKLKNEYSKVYCTNAYNVAIDKNGLEIYGGLGVVHLFKNLNNYSLVFSDPSGKYQEFIKSKIDQIPENVKFISESHDFFEILKLVDGFIRATTTDGDSLSVKEALLLDKQVIVSDCVDRPDGCILFKTNNFNDLKNKIETDAKSLNPINHHLSGLNGLLELYTQLHK